MCFIRDWKKSIQNTYLIKKANNLNLDEEVILEKLGEQLLENNIREQYALRYDRNPIESMKARVNLDLRMQNIPLIGE